MNRPVESPLPGQQVGEAGSMTHKQGTIFPLASRAAATYTSDPLHNYNGLGCRLFINVTDRGASGTVTVKIQVQDPVSGSWMDLGVASAALAAIALTSLTVYPGVTVAANVALSNHLGLAWRVVATVANEAVIFSVGAIHLE